MNILGSDCHHQCGNGGPKYGIIIDGRRNSKEGKLKKGVCYQHSFKSCIFIKIHIN